MLHAPCLDNKSTQKKPDQQSVLTGHYKEVLRRAFAVSKSFRMPSKGLDYIAADPVAHGREYATPAVTASVEDVEAVIAAVSSCYADDLGGHRCRRDTASAWLNNRSPHPGSGVG